MKVSFKLQCACLNLNILKYDQVETQRNGIHLTSNVVTSLHNKKIFSNKI